MILSQFDIYSRDDNIYMTFAYGYKCDDFMENIASSWKYDSFFESMTFVIHDYTFVVMKCEDENVIVNVCNPDGYLSAIQSKMLEFHVSDECVSIYCGYNEVHRYCYV